MSQRTNRYKVNGKDLKIEVEVRSLDDIKRVMAIGGVDRIMFDNFTPELTKEAVKLVAGTMETESSGGITIENLRAYGEAGVDLCRYLCNIGGLSRLPSLFRRQSRCGYPL